MRLLSYNMHKGIGGRDRSYQLERIIAVIEHENPDVICLQEVDRHVARSRFDDQPKLLAKHFNAVGHSYQLNVRLRDGGYGNLLLTRWPLEAQHHISLRLGRRKVRGAQCVAIRSPEGSLLVVNWHLGLAEKERHWQVRHLLGHHLFQAESARPTLIVGDFNDWRNTLADGPFVEHGFEHITAPPWRFRSFPAWLPMGSLDKAFVRGPITVRQARIARSVVGRDASDHLPLVVDFHLGSSS
jgi:endonuclease/exonuclease/phosphatase family metal-dependent hydrolase